MTKKAQKNLAPDDDSGAAEPLPKDSDPSSAAPSETIKKTKAAGKTVKKVVKEPRAAKAAAVKKTETNETAGSVKKAAAAKETPAARKTQTAKKRVKKSDAASVVAAPAAPPADASRPAPAGGAAEETLEETLIETEKTVPVFDGEPAPETADSVFQELAEPKLPELAKDNRARLLMQSPTRLYFYWSIKNNPFQTLQKVLAGNASSYQLVAKLVNRTRDREELFPVEPEGDWWFAADADSDYRAEIGFYAPNRPYIRVMFSNPVETPRKNPSPRQATDADWAVSASVFAEVLDVSGFTRDAFEVALVGDDAAAADVATQSALGRIIGRRAADFSEEEVRFALLALASGIRLEALRGHVSEALFAVLQENAESLGAEKVAAVLGEHFDVFDDEVVVEEETGGGPAVFGASLVNFPRRLKKRVVPRNLSPQKAEKFLSKLSPVSSPGV